MNSLLNRKKGSEKMTALLLAGILFVEFLKLCVLAGIYERGLKEC